VRPHIHHAFNQQTPGKPDCRGSVEELRLVDGDVLDADGNHAAHVDDAIDHEMDSAAAHQDGCDVGRLDVAGDSFQGPYSSSRPLVDRRSCRPGAPRSPLRASTAEPAAGQPAGAPGDTSLQITPAAAICAPSPIVR
jgi:hypothetical protein